MSDIGKRQTIQQDVNCLNVRVTALESTNQAHHEEMMRMLSEMSVNIKENFKEIKDDLKSVTIEQKAHESQIATNSKEIERVDSKLSKIMGALGTALIAVISGIVTVSAKFIGK